uniref:Uncharacterized protein n=1 Tax=Caenorhabditis japonica TaxID=281687 RepID=A0A8R1IAW8_CAEJA
MMHKTQLQFLSYSTKITVAANTTTASTQKSKHAKSLWRRLFMPKKPKICDKIASTNPSNVQLLNHDKRLETSITFVRLENQHDDPEQTENWLTGNYALGYYTGIGRKFERVACGSEITLVVFGHAQAGKTTFVGFNSEILIF